MKKYEKKKNAQNERLYQHEKMSIQKEIKKCKEKIEKLNATSKNQKYVFETIAEEKRVEKSKKINSSKYNIQYYIEKCEMKKVKKIIKEV